MNSVIRAKAAIAVATASAVADAEEMADLNVQDGELECPVKTVCGVTKLGLLGMHQACCDKGCEFHSYL